MSRPRHNTWCTCIACLSALEAKRRSDERASPWRVRRVCETCRIVVQPSYRHAECPCCGEPLEKRSCTPYGPFALEAERQSDEK